MSIHTWIIQTRIKNIVFSLVVDNFGVKYINKKDADHLIMTLQKKYPIKMNWNGDYYLGMTLEWNYHKIHSERNIQLSMSGYVKEALIEFKYHFIKQQFLASPFRDPIYGSKVQYVDVIGIPTFTQKTSPPATKNMWKISILCPSNQ